MSFENRSVIKKILWKQLISLYYITYVSSKLITHISFCIEIHVFQGCLNLAKIDENERSNLDHGPWTFLYPEIIISLSGSSKIHIFLYIDPKQIISNFIRIFFRCIFDRLHFLKVCFNSLWICLNHKKIKIFHFYVYAIYNQLFLAKYCIMN